MKKFSDSIGLLTLGFVLGCGAGVAVVGRGRVERARENNPWPQPAPSTLASGDSATFSPARKDVASEADGWMGSRELTTLREVNPALFGEIQAELGDVLMGRMIEKLAGVDPAAAASFVEKLSHGLRAEATLQLAQRWSRKDPGAALAWYEDQRAVLPDDLYREGLGAVLAEYARHDPSYVFRLTATHPDTSLRDELLDHVAEGWARRDARGAIEWLASLTGHDVSPAQLTRSYTAVMEVYLKENPQEAARAIAGLESQTLQAALIPQVAGELAERDWTAAVDWLGTLSTEPARRAAVEAMVVLCLPSDPRRAFDLLQSSPDLFSDAGGFGREAYFALASAAPSIVKDRFEQIPAAAKPAAVASLSEVWLSQGNTVQEVTSWVDVLPPGPQFDEGAFALAHHLAGESPAAAIEWVNRVDAVERRYELFQRVVDLAGGEDLAGVATTLVTAELSKADRQRLQARLDARLRDEFSTLVLP